MPVISLDAVKRKKRTCSFKEVTPDGRLIHGISAMLHRMKREGGPDAFLENIAVQAGTEAARIVLNDLTAPTKKRRTS